MFNHAKQNYVCPICLGVSGVENEHTLLKLDDRIFTNNSVSAFINSFWIKGNEGHVIVVPNKHYENIYEIPNEVGSTIFAIAKKISILMREVYRCDGITIRQNNEPAADQHALHYHMHIFPRYENDKFNLELCQIAQLSDPNERKVFAAKLRSKR